MLAAAGLWVLGGYAPAAEPAPGEAWSAHGQSTVVEQWHGGFASPYDGLNSLHPQVEDKHTATLTGFFGRRLWGNGELYYNPEITQGNGLSGSVGAAGFPNGEATRAGSNTPNYNTARLFLRQTFRLGADDESVDADKNQVAGARPVERLTLTLGKLSAADIFDGNAYSHDPRTQFLNWSLMDNGAWDYPADVKGYTGGLALEWNQRFRTLRWGAFMEPKEANGRPLDAHLTEAWSQDAEWEERYTVTGHSGALRGLIYWNHAKMGSYNTALHAAGTPDVTLSRAYRSKAGAGLNWEQALAADLGAFARAGFNDGRTETWSFTEIDRSVSAGLSLKGTRWGRREDTIAAAGVCNGLSPDHRRYLAAGGYGFIVGDGALHYGAEQVVEAYYDCKLVKAFGLAADWQWIAHPGYNRSRGPVAVLALRAHAEY